MRIPALFLLCALPALADLPAANREMAAAATTFLSSLSVEQAQKARFPFPSKGTFLAGGIRVPAIISHPASIPQGQSRDQIVTIMDWFPTVLELCAIPQAGGAPELDGHSMSLVIADPEADSVYQVLHDAWAKDVETK